MLVSAGCVLALGWRVVDVRPVCYGCVGDVSAGYLGCDCTLAMRPPDAGRTPDWSHSGHTLAGFKCTSPASEGYSQSPASN